MKKGFNRVQWIIIIILSLLTALEPLSIDLYLPGFIKISETFGVSVSSVQISLSTFLGGFALGQLFWGPLADKYGRKLPILLSLLIFISASIACIYVKTIEQLWIMRFIQAIGGCGGIVISRAVVTDYFDKSQTLKIFSLLALIMGVAPIIAPVVGSGVLLISGWKGLFITMSILGISMFVLTYFLLPETYKNETEKCNNVFKDYINILKIRSFLVYTFIAGIANGALMIYVANGPFLIMEKGGFSEKAFSIIFAINALGLMISSYLTTYFQKYFSTVQLMKKATFLMLFLSIILIFLLFFKMNMYFILVALFFYIFPIGILFPTTTELAITPFNNNAGTASSLFGSIQLLIAFICSIVSNFVIDDSVLPIGISFFICSVISFLIILKPRRLKGNVMAESDSEK